MALSRFSEAESNTYTQIKELMFSGKIGYGKRFTEVQISEKLNVSRMPVREAFKLLMYEGFIERSETTGYKIKTFSEQDIIDIYIFRECIDGMLTYLFTYKHTPSQLFYLENILNKMKKHKDSGNEPLMAQIDQEFHRVIARGAANPQMLAQFELLLQKNIFINHVLIHNDLGDGIDPSQYYTPQHSLSIYLEHEEIINYIKKPDPEGAERCARNAIKEGLKKILAILAERYSHI